MVGQIQDLLLVPSPASLVPLLVLVVPHCSGLLLSMVGHCLRHPVHSLRLQHVVLIRGHRFHPVVDDLLGCDLSAINNSGGGGGGPDAHASGPSHAMHAHRHATHPASKAAAECLH